MPGRTEGFDDVCGCLLWVLIAFVGSWAIGTWLPHPMWGYAAIVLYAVALLGGAASLGSSTGDDWSSDDTPTSRRPADRRAQQSFPAHQPTLHDEKRTCSACGGDGRTRCSNFGCQGGWVASIPAYCHICGGTGSVRCSKCAGSGKESHSVYS